MKVQCCVCKRTKRDGTWQPALHIDNEASHTYCPDCSRKALAEIKAFKRTRRPRAARTVETPHVSRSHFFQRPWQIDSSF